MKKEEYRTLLGQLPIKSPTPDDMARLCPHLTKEQAVKAFTTGSGYVACPPLRVRGGFQIISYSKEWVDEITVSRIKDDKVNASVTGVKNHPATLNWSYASRTRASYADGKRHGDVFSKYKHMKEAMQFAEDNWGSELILDDWQCVGEIYVQDPTDLVSDKYHTDYPRTKRVLRFTLNRDLNKIINDHSKPESELFDESIVEMTLDKVIYHELKGGRGGYTHFHCAFCASELGLSGCSGCGFKFKDDGFRCGGYTPLSPKMVEFLRQNGHVFGKNPEIAWKKERDNWEAAQAATKNREQSN